MRTRKSNRLYTHNYGWKGLYFVTIKTHKEELFIKRNYIKFNPERWQG